MGTSCTTLTHRKGNLVVVDMPVGVTLKDLTELQPRQLLAYLKAMKRLFNEEHALPRDQRKMKKQYTRYETLDTTADRKEIVVKDAFAEISACARELDVLVNSKNRVAENPLPLLLRASYAIWANKHYLRKRRILRTTPKSLRVIQFKCLQPPLARKHVGALCDLHKKINLARSGHVDPSELENYVRKNVQSVEICKSVFFNQIFALPNNDWSFFMMKLNPIDFVQAVERFCLASEKELALLAWHTLTFGTASTQAKHIARHQLQDGLVLLPGDFASHVNTNKLLERFTQFFSPGGDDYNDYNKTVLTILNRVAMLKEQVQSGQRTAGFQKDHVKHGVQYVEAPKETAKEVLWKEWWPLCQSNDMILYPLKSLQVLLQQKTFGQRWWDERRRNVAGTPQSTPINSRKSRGSVIVFSNETDQTANPQSGINSTAQRPGTIEPKPRRSSAPVLRLKPVTAAEATMNQDEQSEERRRSKLSVQNRETKIVNQRRASVI